MTGFDETVPPELDEDTDATSAENPDDNVVPPAGGPTEDDQAPPDGSDDAA